MCTLVHCVQAIAYTVYKLLRAQGENPCHVLLVLLGLMSAPHCTHVRAALVSIKESS